MSFVSTSTASLASTTTTISSSAHLISSTTPQSKDFHTAFATLQSTYGFSATAPSPVPKKQRASEPMRVPTVVTPSVVRSRTPATAPTKDFEAAFADLQSTYGFGGAAPTAITKLKSKTPGRRGSLFSKLTSATPAKSKLCPST
ncbi:hypothetical protein C8F04DRAFT_1097553 [Mycena alexandri]|uniref:Uncharacterized protein n=1 Tax=Mycena alexandri TaxID=1745969 RepID=A0AAD6SWU5_9AGAR|nr:hypothetical protein C8F04DRAFT_1097553 [Mycena alexandri]